MSLVPLLPFVLLVLPYVAEAQSAAASRIVGVFNIFVGLMLTVALLTYGGGFIMWWIRLGSWPTYRTTAIRILEWAVAILFVLIVILGIVQFFQKHPTEASYVLSAIVLILVIWAIVYVLRHSGEKEEKEEKEG